MKPKWFQGNLAYTLAKYGMSMCVLGKFFYIVNKMCNPKFGNYALRWIFYRLTPVSKPVNKRLVKLFFFFLLLPLSP